MTDDQAAAVLDRMHHGKVRYSTRAARLEAERRRNATGEPWHAYRCAVCPAWHLSSHTPNLETLQSIADAIRHRAGNDPVEVAS